MPKLKDGELTPKQAKFVECIIKGKPDYVAAEKAYDIKSKDKLNTASSIAHENLKKPAIKEAIEKALGKHKINIDRAVKPISDALDATKPVVVDDEVVETVDHNTRLKASGMALRLLGADQQQNNQFNNFGNVNFVAMQKDDKDTYGI